MEKINKILSYFNRLYPDAQCALNFSNAYELLIATILSAQCTDKRVNIVTRELFALAPTPQKMLDLGEKKLKEIIHPCGFYNNKSKSIMETSKDLVENFNGIVPGDMESLTKLKGVGRKTANVVLANAFNEQTIAVDTHVHRVSIRLGLTKPNSTPYECEKDLIEIVPKEKHTKFHHQTILFGRNICSSLRPKCYNCELVDICLYANKNLKK